MTTPYETLKAQLEREQMEARKRPSYNPAHAQKALEKYLKERAETAKNANQYGYVGKLKKV